MRFCGSAVPQPATCLASPSRWTAVSSCAEEHGLAGPWVSLLLRVFVRFEQVIDFIHDTIRTLAFGGEVVCSTARRGTPGDGVALDLVYLVGRPERHRYV